MDVFAEGGWLLGETQVWGHSSFRWSISTVSIEMSTTLRGGVSIGMSTNFFTLKAPDRRK